MTRENGVSSLTLLLILFFCTVIVRSIGINYGYWNVDENINLAAKVLAGEIVPSQHFYPPFYNYIVATSFAFLYAIGTLIPIWRTVEEFRAQYFIDPTAFYMTARFLTVVLSSLMAPLFYCAARAYGLNKAGSFFVGCFAIVLPVASLTSHISKSDVLVATSIVFLIWLVFEKINKPLENRKDYLIGLGCSLAISFKHSAIFILFPLGVGTLLLLYPLLGRQKTMMFVVRVFIVSAILTPLLNIGILLDLNNFLEYQKVQSLMSFRDDSWYVTAKTYFSYFASSIWGISLPAFVTWFLLPVILFVLGYRGIEISKDMLLWGTFLFSSIILLWIVGGRQQEGLLVPYMTVCYLSVLLVLARVIFNLENRSSKVKQVLALGVSASIFVSASYGVAEISKQALSRPMSDKVANFIKSNVGENNQRILTFTRLPLPINELALRDAYQRHQNLATKYNIVLPEKATDKRAGHFAKKSYYIVEMDFVMGGLEIYDEAEVSTIKPFAWPLQKEEWTLQYWLDRNITLIVVSGQKVIDSVPAYTEFYKEIRASCELVKKFEASKPVFLESDAKIYDCSMRSRNQVNIN